MITLTQDQIDIYGRPNFQCGQFARMLISSGAYKQPEKLRSEYEQAIVIHYLSGMLEKHGDKWKENAGKEIDEIIGHLLKSEGP